MHEEQNKALIRRFVDEMWNDRKLDVADEIFAADCVTHQLRGTPDSAGTPRNPELVKHEAQAWLRGFPDLQFKIEQIIAADAEVVTRYTVTGTHTGPWNAIPPTNKKISVPMMTVHRIQNGRIVEDWVLIGTLVLFQQLGLLPDTPTIMAAAGKK